MKKYFSQVLEKSKGISNKFKRNLFIVFGYATVIILSSLFYLLDIVQYTALSYLILYITFDTIPVTPIELFGLVLIINLVIRNNKF